MPNAFCTFGQLNHPLDRTVSLGKVVESHEIGVGDGSNRNKKAHSDTRLHKANLKQQKNLSLFARFLGANFEKLHTLFWAALFDH